MAGAGWEYPSAYRTPVYPVFLAILLENIILSIIAQSIVGLSTLAFVYAIGRELLDSKHGLIAIILLAISGESISHSFYLLTETLFTFFLVLSIYCYVLSRKTHSGMLLGLSGLLMAIGILTRPLAVLFPLVFVFFIAIESISLHKKIQKISIFVLACLVIVLPWMFRNLQHVGLFTISTISNENLYYYSAVALESSMTGDNEGVLREKYAQNLERELGLRGLEDSERNRALVASDLATRAILSSPVEYLGVHLRTSMNSLLPDTGILEILGITSGQNGTLDILKQKGLFAAVMHYFNGNMFALLILFPFIVLLGIIYLASVAGGYSLLKSGNWPTLLILSLPAIYLILLPGPPAEPRFRVPAMPLICLISTQGISMIWSRLESIVLHMRQQSKPITNTESPKLRD